MKRFYFILLAVFTTFFGAVLLAGCKETKKEVYNYFLYQSGVAFNPDAPVMKMAEEKTGVKLKGVLQPSDKDINAKRSTEMGKKGIDLLSAGQDVIEDFGLRGDLIDLTPYIEKHAPDLKKFFDENPVKKSWATSKDGKIYGIPFYADGVTKKGFVIRSDWYDILKNEAKLDKDFPALDEMTVSDLETYMRTCKENIETLSGGKVKQKEFLPYFDRDGRFGLRDLMSMWNATSAAYYDKESKTVKFGAVEDEFKKAVEELAKWKKDGLLNTYGLFTKTEGDVRGNLFGSQKGLLTHDWIGSTLGYNEKADWKKDNGIENFKVQLLLPPKSSKGTRIEPTKRYEVGQLTGICPHLNEAERIDLIKWINFWFTKEGNIALNYGKEGLTFNKVDDKVIYTDKVLNKNGAADANLRQFGAQMNQPGQQLFAYEIAWLGKQYDELKKYIDGNVINECANYLEPVNMKLSKDDTKKANEIKGNLEKEVNKYLQDWINTENPKTQISDDDWKAFVSKLEEIGYKTLIEIYQRNLPKHLTK